jgi:zinc/manganese transport system substrate-binding protein
MTTTVKSLAAVLGLCAMALATPAQAALKVLACEPEWGALAQALGGELVEVAVATTALQDPHQIQARPSLIARARNADLLVCTGAELEIGWLPVLLQQSGNPRIQAGQPGHFMAADGVRKLDVPTQLERLQQVDAPQAAQYAQRQAEFSARWQQALQGWQAKAAPLKGLPVVSQHKAFVYLYDWLGLKEVAVLEPKPGVEPSAAYLQQVLTGLKGSTPRMVIHAAYQDAKPSEWLSRQAHVPVVKLPFTVGGSEGARDLFGLFDDTVGRLLAGAGVAP